MCFSAKLLMDCILLLVFMPAVLAYNGTNVSENVNGSTTPPTDSSPHICTYETTSKPNIVTLPPAVGRIKVNWAKDNPCQGYIYFSINFTQSATHLCRHSLNIINENLWPELCEERRCGDFLGIKSKGAGLKGHMIHENLTVTSHSLCNGAFLTCKDVDTKELVAYKVVTGLLLTLIIAVLLCRFAQPAYISIRKRFSQKRQNRWIGPTQSQSVSYHSGQANNNTMKRQSYPGLERLSVNPSREPSSNRNSDYDSYGA